VEKYKNKIAVISFEAGSAEILAKYLKNKINNNYIFFLNSITKKIFVNNRINISNLRFKINRFNDVSKIIFGASYDNKELKLIDKIKKNIKTECFLDHWVFYRKRLTLNKKIYSPSKIFVFDKGAFEIIKEIPFKNTKIILKKNPILVRFKKKNLYSKISKKKSIIFLNNVSLKMERNKEYLSNSLLIKNSIKVLKIEMKEKKYYIKLHPSNNIIVYKNYIKKFKNLILIKEDKLEKILINSKIIITNNSAVLYYASIMGIKNINIIQNNINMIPKKYLDKIIDISSLE
jgi:hypothetical protein